MQLDRFWAAACIIVVCVEILLWSCCGECSGRRAGAVWVRNSTQQLKGKRQCLHINTTVNAESTDLLVSTAWHLLHSACAALLRTSAALASTSRTLAAGGPVGRRLCDGCMVAAAGGHFMMWVSRAHHTTAAASQGFPAPTCMTRCSSATTTHAMKPETHRPNSSSAATASCRLCRRFSLQGSHAINLPIRSDGSCLLLLVMVARRRCFFRCFCAGLPAGEGSAGQASALTGVPSKQGSSTSAAMRPNPVVQSGSRRRGSRVARAACASRRPCDAHSCLGARQSSCC